MKNNFRCIVILLFLIIFMISGCSDGGSSNVGQEGTRSAEPVVLEPIASGENVLGGNVSNIDISNVADGYFMVEYTSDSEKIKMQVTNSSGVVYTYDLMPNDGYAVFPISLGNGSYSVTINENIKGNTYAVSDTASFDVELKDNTTSFLYPNEYVNFDKDSLAVKASEDVAKGASDDFEVIQRVYEYVVEEIDYNYDIVDSISSFYIPDVDVVLESGKGLCFDYAATMTVMLRAQRIPTQLVIGYVDDQYHAWINVYTEETGWIYGAIQFDGKKWTTMDPTLASSSGDNMNEPSKYIGNNGKYHAMFYY